MADAGAPPGCDYAHEREAFQRHLVAVTKHIHATHASSSIPVRLDSYVTHLCTVVDHILHHCLAASILRAYEPWDVVKAVSRKEDIHTITSLSNTKTNLARCRAWIRLGLNDHTLEFSLRSISTNDDLLHKFYSPEALMRDEDSVNVCLAHLASLQHINFEIPVDTPSLGSPLAPLKSSFLKKLLDLSRRGATGEHGSLPESPPHGQPSTADNQVGPATPTDEHSELSSSTASTSQLAPSAASGTGAATHAPTVEVTLIKKKKKKRSKKSKPAPSSSDSPSLSSSLGLTPSVGQATSQNPFLPDTTEANDVSASQDSACVEGTMKDSSAEAATSLSPEQMVSSLSELSDNGPAAEVEPTSEETSSIDQLVGEASSFSAVSKVENEASLQLESSDGQEQGDVFSEDADRGNDVVPVQHKSEQRSLSPAAALLLEPDANVGSFPSEDAKEEQQPPVQALQRKNPFVKEKELNDRSGRQDAAPDELAALSPSPKVEDCCPPSDDKSAAHQDTTDATQASETAPLPTVIKEKNPFLEATSSEVDMRATDRSERVTDAKVSEPQSTSDRDHASVEYAVSDQALAEGTNSDWAGSVLRQLEESAPHLSEEAPHRSEAAADEGNVVAVADSPSTNTTLNHQNSDDDWAVDSASSMPEAAAEKQPAKSLLRLEAVDQLLSNSAGSLSETAQSNDVSESTASSSAQDTGQSAFAPDTFGERADENSAADTPSHLPAKESFDDFDDDDLEIVDVAKELADIRTVKAQTTEYSQLPSGLAEITRDTSVVGSVKFSGSKFRAKGRHGSTKSGSSLDNVQLGAVSIETNGHIFEFKAPSSRADATCYVCRKPLKLVIHASRRMQCARCGIDAHRKCVANLSRGCIADRKSLDCIETRIKPEEGLDSQDFACNECRLPLSFHLPNSERPVQDDYDGKYYCSGCHEGLTAIIPGRVVHNWDFGQQPVSSTTFELLSATFCRPLIDLTGNSKLPAHVHDVHKLIMERTALSRASSLAIKCSAARKAALLSEVHDRLHFLDESMALRFSLKDLCQLQEGKLLPLIQSVVAKVKQHISECPYCKSQVRQ